jgi:hypothetical protein
LIVYVFDFNASPPIGAGSSGNSTTSTTTIPLNAMSTTRTSSINPGMLGSRNNIGRGFFGDDRLKYYCNLLNNTRLSRLISSDFPFLLSEDGPHYLEFFFFFL